MIYPDCDMRAWEICDSSVVLANADNFYSKQQTDELLDSVSGMSPDEVQTMINRSLHSKADKTYVDEQDAELSDSIRAINSNLTRVYTKTDVNNLLDRKQNVLIAGSGITISGDVISSTGGGGDVTSGQVQSMIDHSISGKVDTSTFNTYSASTNVAINNKQDTLIAGDNITIVNNVISSTASGDVTSAQVETMIATSISGKADTTAVTQDIATATADMATQTWVQNQGYLTEHQSLSAYSTTDEMNQAISSATDDMATETWVGNQGYITGVDLSNYATLQDIPTSNSALTNDAGYITSAALNGYATEDYVTAATDDMATRTWVGEQGFLTEHQSLSAYSTTAEMNEAISASTSGKADTTAVTQDIATATNDMATQTWVQNQGYLTEHQSLSAYSTTVEMDNAIDAAVSGKADSTAVTQDIAAATDDMATETWVQNQGYLTEHQSLSAYSTTQEMNDAITAATDDMATETWVNQQGFLTEHQSLSAYSTTAEMNQAISAATSGKVDTSTYTAYTSATDTALQGKQPTLVSGTNIKTINNESILGSGNITVQGSGNPTVEVTQAEYDALVSAGTVSADTFYIITDAEAIDLVNYYTKSETDDLLDTKLDVSAYTPTDLSNYYTKSETSGATQISTALSGKQDTLIAGDNITISGNVISAEGGGGGASYQAGRGIDITNDTISISLPISSSTMGSDSIVGGYYGNTSMAQYGFAYGDNAKCGNGGAASIALGRNVTANGGAAIALGSDNTAKGKSVAIGRYINTNIEGEIGVGIYNISSSGSSTFGDSGNTLFSVGNGTSNSARHNAFEIRQNGDIYCSDGTNDVKLQDYIQFKIVKLTQSEYDSLVQAGTVDASTVYFITNSNS